MRDPDIPIDYSILNAANDYALAHSGCTKVAVGSAIVKRKRIITLGANRSVPDLCKTRGCLRIEKYGDNDKTHRAPGDCRAIHSEIDAICSAGCSLQGATIYVTRYPCEGCARAIVSAGIKRVVYGRQQCISDETQKIFEDAGVVVTWVTGWDAPDAVN